MSMAGGLSLGAAISFATTVTASAVLAKLIAIEKIKWEYIGYYIMIVLLCASFAGAMIAATRVKHRLIAVCAGTGTIYYAVLLLTTAVFFGGQYHAAGVTGFLIAGGSLCAALLLLQKKGENSRRKHRIHR